MEKINNEIDTTREAGRPEIPAFRSEAGVPEEKDQHPYISPVGDDEFPILASTAFYHPLYMGGEGYGDWQSHLDFDRVRSCGFNIIDAWMSFGTDDNKVVNDRADAAGLKIEAGDPWFYKTTGQVFNYAKQCRGLDAITAWKFKDEPQSYEFQKYSEQYNALCGVDKQKMAVSNLLGGFINTTLKGIKDDKTILDTDYNKYVDKCEYFFKPGVWSYDIYPIRENHMGVYMDESGYKDFYGNLIYFACRTYGHDVTVTLYEDTDKKQTITKRFQGRPFWAFVESLTMKVYNSNNLLVPFYPEARESYIRYEAFTALAFGAQGILYWTYGGRKPNYPQVYFGALMDLERNPTEAWIGARRVNLEIHALKDVFLGCRLIGIWFSTSVGGSATFTNTDANKFKYAGDIKVGQDKNTIYVSDKDYNGLGIVTTIITKTVVIDGKSVKKYYKIFLNMDYAKPTYVKFTVVSPEVYSILPDVALAAKKFESKENMETIKVKPIRVKVPDGRPLGFAIPAGGYVIFETPEPEISIPAT